MPSALPRSQDTPLAKLKSSRKINGRITSTQKATFSLVLLSKQGGAIGDGARSLLDLAACANGSSTAETAAFITYALQRLHITTQLGVARTIRANMPIPTGARLLHLPGAVDLGGAPPRSRICQPLAQRHLNRTLSQQQPPQTHAAPTTAATSTTTQAASLFALLPTPHNTTASP